MVVKCNKTNISQQSLCNSDCTTLTGRSFHTTLTGMQLSLFLVHIGRLALVAVLTLLPGCGAVPDPKQKPQAWIESQSWRIDPTGQARLPDAQTATDWQNFQGWRSFGYGPEHVWVRLRLRAAEVGTRTPLVVRVRPAFQDRPLAPVIRVSLLSDGSSDGGTQTPLTEVRHVRAFSGPNVRNPRPTAGYRGQHIVA